METVIEKKYIDESWDFKDANTKTLTHCFHSYPAMMIPQVAARLIEKYGENANLIQHNDIITSGHGAQRNAHLVNEFVMVYCFALYAPTGLS